MAGEEIEEIEVSPDLSEEQMFLTKMLDNLRLLDQYKASFSDERAVCQAQIKALIEQCEISLDDRYPIQSFTIQPSVQNLSVAQASVESRIGELVSQFAIKAMEIIKRIWAWIIRVYNAVRGRQVVLEKRTVVTVTLVRANQELKPIVEHLNTAANVSQERLKGAIAKYEEISNGLTTAMLNEAPFIGVLKAISLVMPQILNLLSMRIDAAEASFAKPVDDSTIARLRDVGKPMEPVRLDKIGAHVDALASQTTLFGYFRALETIVNEMIDSKGEGVDWQIASQIVASGKAGLGEPVIAMASAMGEQVTQLDRRLDRMINARLVDKYLHNPQAGLMASLFEQALAQMIEEVRGISLYVKTATTFLDQQLALITAIFNCQSAQFEYYRSIGEQTKDQTLVVELNRIQRELREKLK